MCPGSHTQLANNCLCPLLFCFFFVSWEVSLFPSILCHSPFPLCMESTLYVFLPDGAFLPCNHGLDFDISLCENSEKNHEVADPISFRVVVCVFSSHSFWTSSSLDVPAGVTQEEGHTGFFIHLLPAVRALIFLARRIQPFIPFRRRP